MLPPSEIGESAVFARRRGDTGFLAVMNGETARTVRIPLAFLGGGKYQATLARDRQEDASSLRLERNALSRKDSPTIELRAGGGFVGKFDRAS